MPEHTPFLARFVTKPTTEEGTLESNSAGNVVSRQTSQNQSDESERPRPRPGTRVTHVDQETTDDT